VFSRGVDVKLELCYFKALRADVLSFHPSFALTSRWHRYGPRHELSLTMAQGPGRKKAWCFPVHAETSLSLSNFVRRFLIT